MLTKPINIRLESAYLRHLDRWSKQWGGPRPMGRTEVIRDLIRQELVRERTQTEVKK